MPRKFATYNALMKHIRNSGIDIGGTAQKRHLLLQGYFHGYKGYRYCKVPQNILPFTAYSQIKAVIEFDESLKAIMYQPLMQLEAAIKSIACDKIVTAANANAFSEIYESLMTLADKTKRLKVRDAIYATMTKRYTSGSRIVKHYYDKDEYVPIWAIFEELMLGELSQLIEVLNPQIKLAISSELGIPQGDNTNGALLPSIILDVKDLRNAIAHNKVIYDARYTEFKKRNAIIKMLERQTGIASLNFQSFADDCVLVFFLMKNLRFNKQQLYKWLNQLVISVNSLYQKLPPSIFALVIPPDTRSKLYKIEQYIKNK